MKTIIVISSNNTNYKEMRQVFVEEDLTTEYKNAYFCCPNTISKYRLGIVHLFSKEVR